VPYRQTDTHHGTSATRGRTLNSDAVAEQQLQYLAVCFSVSLPVRYMYFMLLLLLLLFFIIITVKGIYIAQVRNGHTCAMSAEMALVSFDSKHRSQAPPVDSINPASIPRPLCQTTLPCTLRRAASFRVVRGSILCDPIQPNPSAD